jgi:dolichyl-phosphate-mannose--protein O-mannosyl transferase
MRREGVRLLQWRHPMMLLIGALAFCIVGFLLTLMPFIAIGLLLFAMAAMTAILKPFNQRRS